jgi:hypothetical protein
MNIRRKWVGILVMVVGLLLLGADFGYTDRGGHGYRGHRGHGHRGHGFRHHHHRFRSPRVLIRPRLVVPFGPYWRPYWRPYPYPPVVVRPSPPLATQPTPHYWYYCDHAGRYYPYVAECPGGWRPVTPTPP